MKQAYTENIFLLSLSPFPLSLLFIYPLFFFPPISRFLCHTHNLSHFLFISFPRSPSHHLISRSLIHSLSLSLSLHFYLSFHSLSVSLSLTHFLYHNLSPSLSFSRSLYHILTLSLSLCWLPHEMRQTCENSSPVCRTCMLFLGRRSCLGEELARHEFFLFISGLVQHFTIKPPDGQTKIDVSKSGTIITTPSQFELRMIPRQIPSTRN